jgi:hypothetical protein
MDVVLLWSRNHATSSILNNHYQEPMIKTLTKTTPRRLEFIGTHKDDSIVIGNYGDARLIAKGTFDLSGLIYCGKHTVEINLEGDGVAAFRGVCRRLIIKGINGNCNLDLTGMTTQRIWCESIKNNAVITLGTTKIIELISLDDEAVVKYAGKPVLLNYSLRGNSRIEGWRTAEL